MLYFNLLAVLGSAISVSAAVVAVNKTAPSPTVAHSNGNGTRATTTWTFTGTAVKLQTPTPTAIAIVNKHANITTNAAQVATQPFNTNCCGWAGLYGWTETGSTVAQMNSVCLGPDVPSTLDLNTCLGWDASSGVAGCPNTGQPKGNFLSAQSGCKVAGMPNVLPIGSMPSANTFIFTICNGPQPNTLVVVALDLTLCVGITSDGQLACYN